MLYSRLTSQQIFRGWLGVAIGDAYGAGPEMKSHEHITSPEYFERLDQGYILRDPGFGVGAEKGDHTDDFEMSQGVFRAIVNVYNRDRMQKNGGKAFRNKESLFSFSFFSFFWNYFASWFAHSGSNPELTLDSLRDAWNEEYQENKKWKKGIPRAGYGSWNNVAEASPEEMVEVWTAQRKRQASKDPGNAPNMRQFPIFMYANDEEQTYRNTVRNVLASHPHPLAVAGCLSIAIANEFLVFTDRGKSKRTKDVISHVIEKLPEVLQSEDVTTLLQEDEIYDTTNQQKHFQHFLEKLKLIDEADGVFDVKCSNIDFELLAGMPGKDGKISFAKPLKGGTGLSAKAEQTAYCALYFLKWSDNASIYENLKRTICFGGDTDSLACIVLPTLLVTRDLESDLAEIFPSKCKWIFEDLEAFDFCVRNFCDDRALNEV